jgi:hypothetical protein
VADPVELVVDQRGAPDEVDDAARALRTATSGTVALRALVGQPSLGGAATGLVHTAVEAGLEYLERLRDGGPAAILGGGDPGGGNGRRPVRRPVRGAGGPVPGAASGAAARPLGFGGDAVAERRGGFDPLTLLDR